MIYEQIPNEFMIVPYEDRYFLEDHSLNQLNTT